MTFWAKEKRGGVWDFKGEEDIHREVKERIFAMPCRD